MVRRMLSALAPLSVLLLLVLLDARDLWFKWAWLGEDDGSFLFTSTSVERLTPSAPQWHLTRSDNDSLLHLGQRASGWSSFLGPCAALDGFRNKYFLHVRLRECVVGGNADTSQEQLPQLLATSNVRVDSMAWVACQLLFIHRRPPLCHENVVVEFLRRHAMTYPSTVSIRDLLPPMSDAEAEVLNLLDVISASLPLSSVVCIEGFSPTATAQVETQPSLYGCASPTVHRAAFVGLHAKSFATLHQNLAWLTVHDVNLLGMHYVVRQNARSLYRVLDWDTSLSNDTVTLVHESQVNLSSSGVLWHLLLCVDLALLVAHALSAIELAVFVLDASNPTTAKLSLSDNSLSIQFLTVSLYRSTPVLAFAVVSQLISWILVLPASVIWSWSDSLLSQGHALLSVLRCWVLVLVTLRGLWSFVIATAGEAKAYATLRLTYVAPWEIMAATSLSVVLLWSQLHSIRERKYAIDRQRLVDATTVDGVAVVSNAYHDEQDYFPIASRASVFALVYSPLVCVVALALTLLVALAVVRAAYNRHRKGTTGTGAYARLPAEDLLDVAIRANQLVRSQLSLEKTASLRAEQYIEHGVLLEDGRFLRTRRGFWGVVNPKIHMDDDHAVVGGHGHVDDVRSASEGDEDHTHADSPTKKRRMSRHIPSLR